MSASERLTSTEMSEDEASAWVVRHADLIPEGGSVLDLACGSGRHTRYLLSLGYRVVAVDIDVSRIADLETDDRVEIIETDLEADHWPLEERQFDGIVVTNYLYRAHLARLAEALGPNGVLIYETFSKGNEKLGSPRNPAFLLNPGELLETFGARLTIVAFEQRSEREPRPAVRQRVCAVRNP